MKSTFTRITLFIAALSLYVSINACNKSTADSDLSTVQDNTQAESESDYIQNAADASVALSTEGAQSEKGGQTLPACSKITFANNDTVTGPKTMTITFNGCQCPDYKNRSGSIIVSWTGNYRDSGNVVHIHTQNYVVDGNTYTYSKWVANLGRQLFNDTLAPIFSVLDTATISIHTNNGSAIKWTSSKTRECTSGLKYPWWEYWNTEYSLTGTESGVDRNGVNFTVSITNPIVDNLGCIWVIVQGTYDVLPYSKGLRTVDYGNGSCSGNATCTISGVVYTFLFSNY